MCGPWVNFPFTIGQKISENTCYSTCIIKCNTPEWIFIKVQRSSPRLSLLPFPSVRRPERGVLESKVQSLRNIMPESDSFHFSQLSSWLCKYGCRAVKRINLLLFGEKYLKLSTLMLPFKVTKLGTCYRFQFTENDWKPIFYIFVKTALR